MPRLDREWGESALSVETLTYGDAYVATVSEVLLPYLIRVLITKLRGGKVNIRHLNSVDR